MNEQELQPNQQVEIPQGVKTVDVRNPTETEGKVAVEQQNEPVREATLSPNQTEQFPVTGPGFVRNVGEGVLIVSFI